MALKFERHHNKRFLPHHFRDPLSGEYKALGAGWYAKNINGTVKLFFLLGGNLYREMNRACFDTTMANSKYLPTNEIKNNLKKFEEDQNERKN